MITIESFTLSAAAALLLAAVGFGAAAQPSNLPPPMDLDEQTEVHVQAGMLYQRVGTTCWEYFATREVTTTSYVVVNPAGKVVPGLDAHFGFVGDEVYGDPVQGYLHSAYSCTMFGIPDDVTSLFVPH